VRRASRIPRCEVPPAERTEIEHVPDLPDRPHLVRGGAVRRAAGRTAGRKGNTVGEYICADLACSLYVRGKRQPRMRLVPREETLTLPERIDRTLANLTAFTDRVALG
jgi:hypothetical protein